MLLHATPRSEHDPDPCPDLEAAAASTAAAANIAMHPVTGAFADASHESACAAQLFQMAFPCHAFLMALSLAISIWTSLLAPTGLWLLESWGVAFCITLGLVSRMLVHRMHDTVRGQRLGSWTWTALVASVVIIDVISYVERLAQACGPVALQNEWTIQAVGGALVNGSHGLGFGHKLGLMSFMLLDVLLAIAFCEEVALAGEGMLVVGFVVAHLVEMHLRHSYVERVEKEQRLEGEKRCLEERMGEESRRLEERMEQLQTSNERLLYDVQRRGRPFDDGDDRSAIRRGLQAGSPPSLPPGPPSSTSSGSTVPPPTVAELVARHVEQEVANVLLSCAGGQTNHHCESAEAACRGTAATASAPSAAPSTPSSPCATLTHTPASSLAAAASHELTGSLSCSQGNTDCLAASNAVARGGEVTSAPTPSVAPTHTPTSSAAATAASHELTGSKGPSQSNTDYLTASNGAPTPKQALLIACRDILVAHDEVHVHRVVRTLGMALGATRMEVGSIKALHAVLLQQAQPWPGMNDGAAHRTTGASRSNFTKWRRRVERIQSAGGGSAAYVPV